MRARTEVHHIEIEAPNLPLFDAVEVGPQSHDQECDQ